MQFRLILLTTALATVLVVKSAPLQVQTTGVTVPSSQPGPLLWDQYTVAELNTRSTDPDYASEYNSFKTFVDGNINNLASLSDANLGRFAKGAALLDYMGKVPSPGGSHSTYGSAVVAAFSNIGARDPRTSIFDIIFPPAGNNFSTIVHDSGTLQSMSEAYDLLRNSSSFAGGQPAMLGKINDWADAIGNDYYLTNLTQGESNWATKAGAALVTTGLAIRGNSQATTHLNQGVGYVNASLAKMVDETGYNREGQWYTTYSLNNLVPAAAHVKAATGVDWFQDLKPMVEYSLNTSLPDGTNAAFEEGLRVNLPYDLLAGDYPTLAGELSHAQDQITASPVSSNFGNQQLLSATRFLSLDASIVPVAPSGSATNFIESPDVKSAVLASSHSTTALQTNLIAATDYAATQTTNSRHNSKNFADMVISANGKQVLVTSTGGNQVTSTNAADRANHMNNPMWKNVPLVDGDTDYITNSAELSMGDQLNSENHDGFQNNTLDSATVTATQLGGADQVSRTSGLVNQKAIAVTDRFNDATSHSYSSSWHGRGTRVTTTSGTTSESTWTDGSDRLTAFTVGTSNLTETAVNRLYAESYGGANESIQGVNLALTGTNEKMLTVFHAGDTSSVPTFNEISTSTAGSVSIEMIDSSEMIQFVVSDSGVSTNAGLILTTGDFTTVGVEAGAVTTFSILNGDMLSYNGATLFTGDMSDLSLEYSADGILGVLGQETAGLHDYYIAKSTVVTGGPSWVAEFNGSSLTGSQFTETADGFWLNDLNGEGYFIITQIPEPSVPFLLFAATVSASFRRKRSQ